MSFRALALVLSCVLVSGSWLAGQPAQPAPPGEAGGGLLVYVGTYTRGTSKGIYRLRLDPGTGRLSAPALVAETSNPSFLAAHPTRGLLYAANESGPSAPAGAPSAASAASGTESGAATGTVSAFAIRADGALTPLNQQSSGGRGPAHLTVDRGGTQVLVANYGGGSVSVLPIAPDGRLRAASATVQHEGSSVHPQRQQRPHAHSINVDMGNRFAVAADLGMDRLLVYRFDPKAGTIVPNDPTGARTAPGAGPRHLAFHPNGRAAYVTNEMQSTVSAFTWDAGRGTLTELQTLSTVPEGFTGKNSAADIQVHPSGRFVYSSNRGHDSLAIFAVDEATGRLRLVGHQSTGGTRPRHFGIDSTGVHLLAANQDSGSIVGFRIDAGTGLLTATGARVELETPVCIRFIDRRVAR